MVLQMSFDWYSYLVFAEPDVAYRSVEQGVGV
jgi:hypothetical protein